MGTQNPNLVLIRIDIRSSLHMLVLAVIAISVTVFLLYKASEAIREINALAEREAFSGGLEP
ncbi:hypothetical protein C4552_02470 [Candidatus Parcubacteria bacterium]|nr:MAG: hypothetical protein C4552_02470 [Candidatus Parcubacteria bacterium]